MAENDLQRIKLLQSEEGTFARERGTRERLCYFSKQNALIVFPEASGQG
jgi:hypothetical protein